MTRARVEIHPAPAGAGHARQHVITAPLDHTSSATPGQILQADANGLPVDAANTDAQVALAVGLGHAQGTDTALGAVGVKNPPVDADKPLYRDSTAADALVTSTWAQIKAFLKTYFDTLYAAIGLAHNRLHSITSILDHTSGATPGQILQADPNGLPIDAATTNAQVAAAVALAHARQHAITNALDHTSAATPGKILQADANGLPVDGTNTNADVADAVAKKHTQGTDTALGAVGTKNPPIDADKSLYRDSTAGDALVTSTWTQIKAFLKTYFDTLYAVIAHTHAQLHDRLHSITSALDHSSAATPGKILKADANGLPVDGTNTDAEVADAITKKHTQGTDTALGAVGVKNPPIDADKSLYRDSTAADALVTSTWTQVKAFLKTYFDTIYGAIASAHTRLHAITSALDHSSAATPGKMLKADANGLPVDATNTDAEVSDAVTKKHTQGTDVALGAVGVKNPPIDADKSLYRDSAAADALVTSTWTQIKAFLKTYFDTLYATLAHTHAQLHDRLHSITSALDHSSAATPGKMLKADANGLPVDATNTDVDVADAVTKKHTQGTDTALGVVGTKNPPIDADKSLYRDSAAGDALVTSTFAQVKAFLKTYFDTLYGAIALAHNRQHTITNALDHTSTATPGKMLKADASGLPIDASNTDAEVASAVSLKHTQGTDVALGAVGVKNPPIDADKALYRDSVAADALVTSTWTQVKAFLKTYWDTLYEALGAVATHAGLTTGVHGVGAGTVAKVGDIAVDANLSVAAQDAITKKHTQGTDTALGAVGTKNPPIDADKSLYRDSTAADALVTSTWTQIKAFLKTYFDTLYGAIALAHARLHSITSVLDHTSAATPGKILKADANGLPVEASNTDAEVSDAVAKKHTQGTDTALGAVGVKNPPIDADKSLYRDSAAGDALVTSTWTQIKAFLKTYFDTLYGALGLAHTRLHSITSILDHSSAATPGKILKADANGLPVDATNTDANVADAVTKKHTQGTDTTLGTLTANVNFAKYKAIAMVCDNGATVPALPVAAQWFLHTPTGRKVLMQYDGSNWIPIISLGTVTMYVDNTDGTDDLNHGTAVNANAFKTIQYAIDCIPGMVGGNVTVNINEETYSETVNIRGKNVTGNYTITLQGTLVAGDNLVADGNGDKGATTTPPSFYEDGMTTNEYQNKLLKFTSGSNNGLYRVIDSNSDDAGTHKIILCGPTLAAQPVATDTATVYNWGTTTNRIVLTDQGGIYVYDMKTNNATYPISVSGGGLNYLYRCCQIGAPTSGIIGTNGAFLTIYQNLTLTTGSSAWRASLHSEVIAYGSKIANTSTAGTLAYAEGLSLVYLHGGNVIDGVTVATQKGLFIKQSSIGLCWAGTDVYNFIRNCDVGVYAESGGEIMNTSYNVYSGNNTDESAVAASFSYID